MKDASSPKKAGNAVISNASSFYTKWLALTILTAQNAAVVLFMRYSRIYKPQNELYITTTGVVNAEIIKFVVASLLCFIYDCDMSIIEFKDTLNEECIKKWREFALLAVPSGLYVVQNNLQYLASSNLPAEVFQVLSNLKIVTTAILSVLMLNRTLSNYQWFSIVALTIGVGIVQTSFAKGSSTTDNSTINPVVGFVAVLGMVSISGFAGVFFEKVLKTTAASIWVRNIQLALIGMIISTIAMYIKDGEQVQLEGFYKGYDWLVWTVVCLAALGGLVVAVVVKYADNVIKGFAAAIALVISCFVSVAVLHDGDFNVGFMIGATTVLSASIIYSNNPPKVDTIKVSEMQKYEKVSTIEK